MVLIKQSMAFGKYFMGVRKRRTPINVERMIRLNRLQVRKIIVRLRCEHASTALSRATSENFRTNPRIQAKSRSKISDELSRDE